MAIINLYLASPYDRAATPQRLYEALLIENWEERDSDNYAEGLYYLGEAGSLEIKLWADRFEGFEEYPFRVSIDFGDDADVDAEHAADMAILELLKAGFSIARELGYENGVVTRELYSIDRSGRLVRTEDTRPARDI